MKRSPGLTRRRHVDLARTSGALCLRMRCLCAR
ncbi:putative leader peptide [Streptomyces sp. NPDC086010]